jgi:hypothetical protein
MTEGEAASTMPTVHIVFHRDAVDDLREAVRQAGRLDRVTVFRDDFSFGPISPPDPDQREAWVRRALHHGAWYEETVGDTEPFWHEALEPGKRLVAWTSRRSAMEYTGFLEWLRRLGNLPCEVVDLTETMVVRTWRDGSQLPPRLALSLAHLCPEKILELRLLDAARPLDEVSRQRHLNLWHRLRAENAPLRIFSEAGLQSADLTVFDAKILDHVVSDWRKVARVVGEVLSTPGNDKYADIDTFVLSGRVRALVKAGKIESAGDVFRIRYSEVRLPRAPGPVEVTS